jgi:hypothetical protein
MLGNRVLFFRDGWRRLQAIPITVRLIVVVLLAAVFALSIVAVHRLRQRVSADVRALALLSAGHAAAIDAATATAENPGVTLLVEAVRLSLVPRTDTEGPAVQPSPLAASPAATSDFGLFARAWLVTHGPFVDESLSAALLQSPSKSLWVRAARVLIVPFADDASRTRELQAVWGAAVPAETGALLLLTQLVAEHMVSSGRYADARAYAEAILRTAPEHLFALQLTAGLEVLDLPMSTSAPSTRALSRLLAKEQSTVLTEDERHTLRAFAITPLAKDTGAATPFDVDVLCASGAGTVAKARANALVAGDSAARAALRAAWCSDSTVPPHSVDKTLFLPGGTVTLDVTQQPMWRVRVHVARAPFIAETDGKKGPALAARLQAIDAVATAAARVRTDLSGARAAIELALTADPSFGTAIAARAIDTSTAAMVTVPAMHEPPIADNVRDLVDLTYARARTGGAPIRTRIYAASMAATDALWAPTSALADDALTQGKDNFGVHARLLAAEIVRFAPTDVARARRAASMLYALPPDDTDLLVWLDPVVRAWLGDAALRKSDIDAATALLSPESPRGERDVFLAGLKAFSSDPSAAKMLTTRARARCVKACPLLLRELSR